jgi:type IV pilus assembly protein PilA
MSEVVLAASGCRTTISEIYQTGNSAPAAGSWGCEGSSTSRYVSNVTTGANGEITVTVSSDSTLPTAITGSVLTLIPYSSSGAMNSSQVGSAGAVYKWICGGTGTTIDKKYLPGSCRG